MSKRSSRGKTCGVLVDIGSGSVGVGIVLSDLRNNLPVLLYTHRETVRVGKDPTVDDRVRAMREALFSAVLAVSNTGLRKLKEKYPDVRVARILVTCAAPWSRTVTQTIHYEKEESFEVTHELVEKLVENAQKQLAERTDHAGVLDKLGMQTVETSIIGVSLNGYSVDDPYEKEAKEVDVSHITGLVPNDVLEAIDEIEKNIMTGVDTSAHTYALVLYCVLRDLHPEVRHALIIDVTGEATEVSIMHENVLLETRTILHGTYTLARTLAGKLNTIPEEAGAHMRNYHSDTTTSGTRSQISEAAVDFQNELTKVLSVYSRKYVLPQQIFLSIDSDMQALFSELLSNARKEVSGAGAPTIVPLDKKEAAKLATFESKEHADQFLAVSARFFHKMHGCGEIDTQ